MLEPNWYHVYGWFLIVSAVDACEKKKKKKQLEKKSKRSRKSGIDPRTSAPLLTSQIRRDAVHTIFSGGCVLIPNF
jgi:hypothetical protein